MPGKFRSHVGHNVIGYLALFFALTGVAYAAGPLKPGDPAGGDLTGTYPDPSITQNAVNSGKVSDDSLTGADVDESSLGKVPDADSADDANSLGGIGATGYVRGSANFYSNRTTVSDFSVENVLNLQGLGVLTAGCQGNEVRMIYFNNSGETIHLMTDDGVGDPSSQVFQDGAVAQITPPAELQRVIVQLGRDLDTSHDLATITATGEGDNPCVVQAQAMAHTN